MIRKSSNQKARILGNMDATQLPRVKTRGWGRGVCTMDPVSNTGFAVLKILFSFAASGPGTAETCPWGCALSVGRDDLELLIGVDLDLLVGVDLVGGLLRDDIEVV